LSGFINETFWIPAFAGMTILNASITESLNLGINNFWLIAEVSGLNALPNGYTLVPFRNDILVAPPLEKGGKGGFEKA